MNVPPARVEASHVLGLTIFNFADRSGPFLGEDVHVGGLSRRGKGRECKEDVGEHLFKGWILYACDKRI